MGVKEASQNLLCFIPRKNIFHGQNVVISIVTHMKNVSVQISLAFQLVTGIYFVHQITNGKLLGLKMTSV